MRFDETRPREIDPMHGLASTDEEVLSGESQHLIGVIGFFSSGHEAGGSITMLDKIGE